MKRSSEILNGVFSRLKETVHHQRGFHEDLQTLRRSRWKLNSPDQEWRSDVWHEPLNTIVKRISSPYRSLELFRTSDGTLSALFLHQQTGIQLRVESHNMDHSSSTPYYSSGIRSEVGDLYRPLSNSYSARTTLDIHRLWMWITKSYEDMMLWNALKKAAVTEGLEIRAEEIIVPMPNSSDVFSLHALKPKHNISRNPEQSRKASGDITTTNTPAHGTQSAMEIDENPSSSSTSLPPASQDPDSTSNGKQRKRRRISREFVQTRRNDSAAQNDSLRPSSSSDPIHAIAGNSAAENDAKLESDFDVALSQDLMLLTMKQTTMIMQHGQQLDTTRFPLFPNRRVLHPTTHLIFATTISAVHHFRQLLAISRLLDDLCYTLPRVTGTGPLHIHFEATSLATVATLHITFCSLQLHFSINSGKFVISPTEELDEPIQFIQHLTQLFASYLIESVQQHVNALCGPNTVTLIHSRGLNFPLGTLHPLSQATSKSSSPPSPSSIASLHASFELPYSSLFGLVPTLILHPRIPGIPTNSSVKWPQEIDVWFELSGSNFAEKLTSLILGCR